MEQTENRQVRGISGNALKMIAIITMAIDHIGASLIEGGLFGIPDMDKVTAVMAQDWSKPFWAADLVLRIVGRVAFPIFCFLLVEGFLHTSNVKRYAKRLFLFALISEVPFDLAIFGTPFYIGYQNVYFTLLLGLGAMYCYDRFTGQAVKQVFCVIVACVAAQMCRTDYGTIGIVLILVLYLFRNNKKQQTIWGVLLAASESMAHFGAAALSFIPIRMYHGERGKANLKYFFYWFYPAHLLILGVIRLLMGSQG